MSRLLSILAALALSVTVAGMARAADTVNDWQMTTAAGDVFDLGEQAGEKTYLVLFWATWCPYCSALMPHLESLLIEHGKENLEVLAITIGEDGDPSEYLQRRGYHFTLLQGGESVAKRYGVTGTPGVIIVDKRGEVAFDLRRQPKQALDTEGMKHRAIATRRAPYWAAQIRGALDDVLD